MPVPRDPLLGGSMEEFKNLLEQQRAHIQHDINKDLRQLLKEELALARVVPPLAGFSEEKRQSKVSLKASPRKSLRNSAIGKHHEGHQPTVRRESVRRSVSYKAVDQSPAKEDEDEGNRGFACCMNGRRVKIVKLDQPMETELIGHSEGMEPRAKLPGCCDGLRSFVTSQCFDQIMGIVVMSSVCLISVETDYNSRHLGGEQLPIFYYLDLCCCVLFLIELGLRLSVYGLEFFYMNGWTWNVFDFTLVVLQVADLSKKVLFQLGFSALGLLRLLRFVRIFRLIRVLHLIEELHTIVLSISHSSMAFVWTLLLLSVFIIGAGTVFIQILVDFRESGEIDDSNDSTILLANLEHYWNTIPRAALTLFEAIAGGVSWDEVVAPLFRISPFLGIGFCIFIAFSYFALMNVITGIFVNGALTSAEHEKSKQAADSLHKAFDSDGTGHVTRDEFDSLVLQPGMLSFITDLSLNADEAKDIWELLDRNRDGDLDLTEFIDGCVRLRRPAQALEIELVLLAIHRLGECFLDQMSLFDKRLAEMLRFQLDSS